jgi:aryl-alcohol dehydrogenase-like predicted oxidoreductase
MPSLPHRTLGDLDVSAIGFGAMVLSPGVYGDIDDAAALTALRGAIDRGSSFIDTADGYGVDGHNERLVGGAIRGRRDDVVVATKFGFRVPDGRPRRVFPVGFAFGELAVNADPALVRGYAEQSLRELGTDHIDLYYPHYPDPEIPLEDTVGAVADLIADGLVRHLGLSNVSARQLRAAHAVHPVSAVQVEWSMWRPIEHDLLQAATELGVGLVAWSPLGAGFLTGNVTSIGDGDFRQNAPRFTGGNLTRNHDRFAPIRDIAAQAGLSAGQLALAWLLAQYPHAVPIPGSRNPIHIEENLDAARATLSTETLSAVDAALAGISPSGATLL